VLAARIGGAVEAVDDGTTGMFVDKVTVDTLETRLRLFLSGETAFNSEACVAFAHRFTWQAVAEHCLEHYRADASPQKSLN